MPNVVQVNINVPDEIDTVEKFDEYLKKLNLEITFVRWIYNDNDWKNRGVK